MSLDNRKQSNWQAFRRSNSVSVKLVIETLIFSLCFSILVSGIQIYSAYNTKVRAAEARYYEIETGFLPSLSAALWEVNNQRVEVLLDSIAKIPSVGRIVLYDEEGNIFSRNQFLEDIFSTREMKLIYSENGYSFEVGVLVVELNRALIFSQLKSQAVVMASVTALTLFATSLFILFLFQRRVSVHLKTMAGYASAFSVQELGPSLVLTRKPNAKPDELDVVVGAINDMQRELKRELTLRAGVEQELRAHQENLENLVKVRTQALKSSMEQLAVAADVAELGVWQWDIVEKSVVWNERMFTIFSQPISLAGEKLHFQHWHKCIHPEDLGETLASLEAEVAGLGKMKPVFRILLPDGKVRYVQTGLQVERDEGGNALRAIGINRDISSRMEIENDLRAAKQLAEVANATKSSFLANMSHEIRTPMNAVLGMLQLLQRTDLKPNQIDYLDKCQNAAKSLLNLLNDILDLSKAEAGRLLLDNNPFDLESLLQDLAVVLAGSQKDKNVELMFDLDPHLPRHLIGDKFRLQQILINLASNALKFTHAGQVQIVIKQTARSGDAIGLKFSVIDTGIGIAAEHLSHIFEEFVQAEASTTRRFGGTGLGLVICKRLVELMGGALNVKSEFGLGSHFWFDLTLSLSHVASAAEIEFECSLANARVLVVEDNAVSQEILVRVLEYQHAAVDRAVSGLDALEKIKKADHILNPYDVVLMDWRMPDLDGLRAAELIKSAIDIVAKPTVVLLTAYGRDEILGYKSEDEPPYADVLFKPVTPLQLVKVLDLALRKQRQSFPSTFAVSKKPLRGLKILLVEDNEINRQIAFELLSDDGAEVEVAVCGVEGVEKVLQADQHFDLVLMDIQMPDIDGFEATRRIRADSRFANLPILAMTANVAQTDIEACVAAGMDGHIGKPIDMDEVIERILAAVAPTPH